MLLQLPLLLLRSLILIVVVKNFQCWTLFFPKNTINRKSQKLHLIFSYFDRLNPFVEERMTFKLADYIATIAHLQRFLTSKSHTLKNILFPMVRTIPMARLQCILLPICGATKLARRQRGEKNCGPRERGRKLEHRAARSQRGESAVVGLRWLFLFTFSSLGSPCGLLPFYVETLLIALSLFLLSSVCPLFDSFYFCIVIRWVEARKYLDTLCLFY